MRRLIALLVVVAACDHASPPQVTSQPLSADVMRAMIAPGKTCVRKFRGAMPASYTAQARVSRSSEGFLTLELRSGDRADFNACMVDAIRAARIPVEAGAPVEMPLAFDFAS